MEQEVVEAELVLPTHMKFKKIQVYEKYPRDKPKQDGSISSRLFRLRITKIVPSMNQIAPYFDPRTTLSYTNTEVFKLIRSLPNDYVQWCLALRNAAIVLR